MIVCFSLFPLRLVADVDVGTIVAERDGDEGWENVPPAQAYILPILYLVTALMTIHSWLYMLMVAMDANFRLKSRL